MKSSGWAGAVRGILSALLLGFACLGAVHAQDAAALRARHASLREQLASSPFQRPLVLVSSENAGDLKGEVYAVVDQPFAVVSSALQGMDHWCDLLILHLNVKNCTTSSKPANVLTLFVGRKFDQPLDDAYQVNFNYRLATSSTDYLQVQLSADTGPMSTRNYRLALEAVPLDDKRTFIHMSYSYAYGMAARLAMQTYLATIGRDKIGFNIVGKGADGKPVYVDGVRGVVERNTMRYFLAIDAYLGATTAPASDQVEKRLRDWFDATERYAPQLHEMERADYLDMKRREVQRQLSGAKSAKSG
jgi:hypothetical protein